MFAYPNEPDVSISATSKLAVNSKTSQDLDLEGNVNMHEIKEGVSVIIIRCVDRCI
jgi:hypothetical protein